MESSHLTPVSKPLPSQSLSIHIESNLYFQLLRTVQESRSILHYTNLQQAMWFSLVAIIALTAHVVVGDPMKRNTLHDGRMQPLLDELTSYNASEEIVADMLQYSACLRDKVESNQPEESLDGCTLDKVADTLEGWNSMERYAFISTS